VKGENLSLTYYSFASSKLQVTGDVSPGPNLPKEKEPPHRGDIGWDRFLLRQFDLQTSSFCPPYKLCDNRAFFQLHPISDDAEDLAMKLFSATLHDGARRWYNGLPDASIKTMDKLEEIPQTMECQGRPQHVVDKAK
jgi:hypothetical protein